MKSSTGLKVSIVVIVLVIIGALALIFSSPTANNSSKIGKGTTTASTSSGRTAAPASVVSNLSGVSMSTLDAIGVGTANAKPKTIKAPALTNNGKPEVFYEGAEFCPYCATERWAMGVALSKFGTFKNLGLTHSSSTDVYPNTQTLSFYQSTYSSPYISFVPLEIYSNVPSGNAYGTLQTPTTAENNLVNKYDSPPYVSASQAQSIPFIDFGGKFLSVGATYSPTVLQGKSAESIAGSLSDATNPIAMGADGSANLMIASICKLTNNKPTTVCDATIQKIEKGL